MRKVMDIPASPDGVFRFLDDPLNTGSHMQKGGLGGHLQLEVLSGNYAGEGATHRWHGKVFGWKVDFTTVVERWVKDKEKAYRTIGTPRMVVMSNFAVHWALEPVAGGTRITVDFDYEPPSSWLGSVMSRLFGRRYGQWCLNMVLSDAVKSLRAAPIAVPNKRAGGESPVGSHKTG